MASSSILIAIFGLFAFIASAGKGSAQETFEFAYINSPITESILPLYEEITGKKLIVDSSIAQAQVTIQARRPLAADEAIPFIEGSLLINGFAIVQVDDRTAKVVNAQAKPPSSIATLPVFIAGDDLPTEEMMITYVMVLNYITPDDAVRTFQLVARPNTALGASIAPVPNANAVIITDITPVIKTLVELKDHIDVPPGKIKMEAFKLERATAEDVATSLTEILTQQNSARSGQSGSGGRGAAPAAVPFPPAAAISSDAVGGAAANAAVGSTIPDGSTVQVQAIARTNSVLVIARPMDFPYIETLIELFDAPSQVDNFLIRELKYLSVGDFMPVAADALSRYQEGGTTGGTAGGGGGRTTGTSNRTGGQGNNRSSGLGSNNSRSSLGGTGGGGIGGGSGGLGGGGLGGGNLQSPQELGGPESMLIGNTLIIGDSQLNNIIVSGPPEHLRIIDELLDKIDIRPRQVYITAVIAQVTLGDGISSGIDLLRRVDDITIGGETVNIAGLYRTTGSDGPTIIDPLNLQLVDEFPLAAASGLNIWAQVGSFLNTYVEALENTNRFQVLSRPFVFTANNQRANIASGQRVAVPTQSISSVTNNDTVNSSIGFEEIVLQLEVIPLINSKDEVTLTISQQNENITGFTTISNNQVPNIATQSLNTTVRLPNKGIVVLGGIIQESESKNADGLPIISRIPILKNLTGTTSRQKDRAELLIFLQPHIIEGGDDLIDANVQAVSGTIVGEDALRQVAPEPEQHPSLFPDAKKKGFRLFRGSEEQAAPSGVKPPAGTLEYEALKEETKKRGLSRLFNRNSGNENATEAPEEEKESRGFFGRRKKS